MFENFTTAVRDSSFSDEQIETFFYLLDPNDHAVAFELLNQRRPELAKKIAREILAVATA